MIFQKFNSIQFKINPDWSLCNSYTMLIVLMDVNPVAETDKQIKTI